MDSEKTVGPMPVQNHLCDVCGKYFDKQPNLASHRRNVHKIKRICNPESSPKTFNTECPICKMVFEGKRTVPRLELHMATHKPPSKIFKCKECRKSCKTRKALQVHTKRYHKKELNFVCELCTRPFFDLKALHKHVLAVHVVDKEFECSVCHSTFANESSLKRHRLRHEDRYKCDVCDSPFSFKGELKTHVLDEHARTEFCLLCAKSFLSKKKHSQHLDTTNSIKCSDVLCSLEFASECLFRQHLTQAHVKKIRAGWSQGKKSPLGSLHPCEYCLKKYVSNIALEEHIQRLHPEVHQCSDCKLKFRSKTKLSLHQFSEDKTEQPFACPVCAMRFCTFKSRITHEEAVHLKSE